MNNLDIDLDEDDLSIKKGKQYLLFLSGGDLFAIESLIVTEIVEYNDITKVPMMKSYVKGVTNIRGNIIPVVDLRERFGFLKTQLTDKTSMIIVNIYYEKNEKNIHFAIIIDEVFEVVNIDIINIKHTPEFGTKIDKKFIESMAKYNDRYIPILDINVILNIKELSILNKREVK